MSINKKSVESTIKTTFITEKTEKKCTVSSFLVLSLGDAFSDWITEKRSLQIIDLRIKQKGKPFDVPLTKTYKGNLDNGRDPKDGKAMRIHDEDGYTIIEVYTQTYGEGWKFSHKHSIPKDLFEAYMLVLKNTRDVLLSENEFEDVENFSMGLEKAS